MVKTQVVASALLLLLAGCGQQGAASAPPKQSASGASASTQAAQGNGRCATSQLRLSLGKLAAATGNRKLTINVSNASTSSCYLGGYPGVELLDAAGRHLRDAQRSTDSFFGRYPPPHRVDIPPGGATTFDLTYGGIDPCGVPAQHGAALRITPPNDYSSATIAAADFVVCGNGFDVHPIGSGATGSGD